MAFDTTFTPQVLAMNRQELIHQIRSKQSFLCIGLDTDPEKLPSHILQQENPVLYFNRKIIEATQDLCVSYKINTAFYEAQGVAGWENLQKTLAMIPPQHFIIADAKRGDIGNTSTQYAKAFFEVLGADSVTVAPYMGKDSVSPFLQFDGKWAIVLALTSNEGANDFQYLPVHQKPLYLEVMKQVSTWGTPENLMFVVGATRSDQLIEIRKQFPEHFLLVPGVGAQGGSLAEVCRHGMNPDIGILVNVSRQILYAGSGEDFAVQAREQALQIQQEMAAWC